MNGQACKHPRHLMESRVVEMVVLANGWHWARVRVRCGRCKIRLGKHERKVVGR